MAAKKKATPKGPETRTVEVLRHLPATMLQADGETRDYGSPGVAPGSQRTLPAAVADRLIAKGHAREK